MYNLKKILKRSSAPLLEYAISSLHCSLRLAQIFRFLLLYWCSTMVKIICFPRKPVQYEAGTKRFLCPYKANENIQLLLKNMDCTTCQTPPVVWSTEQARKPNTKMSSWQLTERKLYYQNKKSVQQITQKTMHQRMESSCFELLWQGGQKLNLSQDNY